MQLNTYPRVFAADLYQVRDIWDKGFPKLGVTCYFLFSRLGRVSCEGILVDKNRLNRTEKTFGTIKGVVSGQ